MCNPLTGLDSTIPFESVLTTLSLPLYDSSNRTSDSTDCCMFKHTTSTQDLGSSYKNFTNVYFPASQMSAWRSMVLSFYSQWSQLDFETGSTQIDSSRRSSSQSNFKLARTDANVVLPPSSVMTSFLLALVFQQIQ